MSDLIDREALQHRLAELMSSSEGNENIGVYKALKEVNWIPSIDAVEVVRCVECKYYPEKDCFGNDCCNTFLHHSTVLVPRKPTDYCSHGKRKEDKQ